MTLTNTKFRFKFLQKTLLIFIFISGCFIVGSLITFSAPLILAYLYATPTILFLIIISQIILSFLRKQKKINQLFKMNKKSKERKNTIQRSLYWYFRWIFLALSTYFVTLAFLGIIMYPAKWLLVPVNFENFIIEAKMVFDGVPQYILLVLLANIFIFPIYIVCVCLYLAIKETVVLFKH